MIFLLIVLKNFFLEKTLIKKKKMMKKLHSLTLIAVVVGIAVSGTMTSPTLAQTKQVDSIIQGQGNSQMPMNRNMNSGQHDMDDMPQMMTQMQEMMTQMQKMITNMTPEQRQAHEQMMGTNMQEMMKNMNQMHQMMMENSNHNTSSDSIKSQ